MDQLYLRQFEQRCTQEEPPACQTTCPIHVEARTFLDLMIKGKLREARKCLDRTMPLSSLTGLLCDGPCLDHCVRGRVDSPVNLPLVEQTCILHTSPGKLMALPGSGHKIAVVGASLSGLAVAQELAKKSHGVTVFYDASLGEDCGRLLLDEFSAKLTADVARKAVDEVLGQLKTLKVLFTALDTSQELNEEYIASLEEEYAAVFLGFDDSRLFPPSSVLTERYRPVDDFTQRCATAKCFAGGREVAHTGEPAPDVHGKDGAQKTPGKQATSDGALSPIARVALGKRAAGSIARLLQGVDPATARENELVRPTKLFTSTADVEHVVAVVPVDEKHPSMDEGRDEATRCIQCNCLECVKVCPYLAAYQTYPKKLAREIYNNLSVIKGLRQTNQAINSCAECGLCAVVCPNDADMGLFCAAARNEMVADNRMPPSAHEFALLDMEQSNDDSVAFIRHQPGFEKSAYLFFPGCQLPASLPEETLMAYTHLCKHLEGGVGLYFHCCGAPARWSGREKLTAGTAAAIAEEWERFGKPEVITACASCHEFFAAELPHIPCRALWDVLAETPLPFGDCSEVPLVLALHDPCASRYQEETRRAVRSILDTVAVTYEELPLHGVTTRCCGYGGLAVAANPPVGAEFARERIKDSDLPMLAYCAMCRERLAAEGKETVHLLELLSGINDWKKALQRKPLGISERQYGREVFREEALTMVWQEETNPAHDVPFTVTYAEGVQELLEQRRIREADIIHVLEHAREHGPLFKDPEHKWFLASLRPRQVTFWVRYTESAPDAYVVYDAYCHRMVVPGVPGEGGDTPCTLEGYAVKGVR